MIKALILAAGSGTRLKHLTKNKPKALVKINGIPILEHQLKILIKNNINEIYIVIGFKGYLIKNYIKKKFAHLNIVFIENKIFYKTESSYSYYLAKRYIYNKRYFHINCDVLFSNKTIKSMLRSKHSNLICTRKTGKLANNMHLVRVKNNLITKYENFFFYKDQEKIFGLAKFSAKMSKKLFDLISLQVKNKNRNKNCFSFISETINKIPLHNKSFDFKNLYEINTVNELRQFKKR